ncbi:MAG: exosortase E/protease, VPEID-CTERM system, partial [Hyphomicrobiaceae bacterium]
MQRPAIRAIVLSIVFVAEILAVTLLQSGDQHVNTSLHAVYLYLRQLSLAATLIPVCFAVLTWLNWRQVSDTWLVASAHHNWSRYLLLNLILFAILLATIVTIGTLGEHDEGPPVWMLAPYLAMLAATGLSMVFALAPPLFWSDLWRQHKTEIAIAIGYSGLVLLISNVMQRTWEPLSSVTLYIAGAVLRLVEKSVEIDFEYKDIYFREFAININAQCSGYDGIGLILAFLTIFLYTMRHSLRFPNAFLLIPIGVVTIWVLNVVRIIILVCIGGYISPSVAVQGFHSQAGWLAFLAVTVAVMWAAYNSPIFCKVAPAASTVTRASQDDPILAYLAPFMALLTANILSSLAAPYGFVFYPLLPLLVGLALWAYRETYIHLLNSVSMASIVVGLTVGALWVATDQTMATDNAVAIWLHSLPMALAIGWITLRGIGTIILVPMAEELAFRGYFHRALQARDWHRIPIGRFSIIAFLITSASFG